MSLPSFHAYPAQNPDEFESLCGILRQRQPRRVLEIGSRHGRSLLRIAEAAQPALERIVALDLPGAAWGEASSRTVLEACVQDLAARWAGRLDARLILGDSHAPETVDQVRQLGPFDFVFIDADHSEEGCQTDLDNYLPLLAPGGCAALHDIAGDETSQRTVGNQTYRLRVPTVWRRLRERHPEIREMRELIQPKSGFGIGLVFL